MKIMILGGFGFIGSHLADSLIKNKHDLILVTKTLSKQKNVKHMKKNVKIEKIDITNFSKIEKCLEQHRPQVIIHLAGQTSHSKSFQDPIKDLKSNALSTLFLLEKIKNMKLKCRFILGSTFIVIGKPDKLPITESSPCNPRISHLHL